MVGVKEIRNFARIPSRWGALSGQSEAPERTITKNAILVIELLVKDERDQEKTEKTCTEKDQERRAFSNPAPLNWPLLA